MGSKHRLLLLFSFISYVAAKGCEPITIQLCKDIGYNQTSYPNIYGHEKQEEAGLEVHQFYPLVEVGCYQHLKFFLCTLYTPICQDNYDRPILPCMELCLEAKKKCSPIMTRYGFRWPDALTCETLPKMADQMNSGNICAAPPDTPKQAKKQNSVITSSKMNEFNPVVDIGLLTTEFDIEQCSCECNSPFQKVANKDMMYIFQIGNVSGCYHNCHAPPLTERNKPFVTSWMGFWSIICFILSAFTFLTFLIDTDRFQYPERPIFFLSFCQMMVAIGFIVRLAVGHENVVCDGIKTGDEGSGFACFAIFLLTYGFGMSASVWWLILALTWVLAAASKWSSEAIASYSAWFHILGWVVPFIQTALVVVFQKYDGNYITGMCYVGNTDIQALRIFVIGPLVVYFSFGVLFLLIGFFNLWSIRNEVAKQHPGLDNASKLTQLMSKIGIFSVLYTIPALFVILIFFYEQSNRPIYEDNVLCGCSQQKTQYGDVILILTLVKTACMCIVGVTTGVWVFSKKTLSSWVNLLCCLGRPVSTAKYQPAELLYAKSDMSSPPAHFYNTAMRQQTHHMYGGIPDKL